MREQRLLERITAGDASLHRTHAMRLEVLIASIATHIGCILNTRRASVPANPAFGAPDFTNLAGSLANGDVAQIIDDITGLVRRYEPRLLAPSITLTESSQTVLTLAFVIRGTVALEHQEVPLVLATRVSASGHVSLERG
ncbi:type VI secretion protein [Pandoraea iniqua]|uniref:Type VI secretion protein n=1 Tax=Pandoraea iniqua TaxID=2508288 RepID=A0A5E4YD07_9BURK|nr:type VI secretion system baseplate subunit TssE [Pandoraea iniqua]VVE46626.1 type VI secretion protein [Pandoraea iniqua]